MRSSTGNWARRSSTAPDTRLRRAVIIERSMHDDWLSNAYLVADEPGGTA